MEQNWQCLNTFHMTDLESLHIRFVKKVLIIEANSHFRLSEAPKTVKWRLRKGQSCPRCAWSWYLPVGPWKGRAYGLRTWERRLYLWRSFEIYVSLLALLNPPVSSSASLSDLADAPSTRRPRPPRPWWRSVWRLVHFSSKLFVLFVFHLFFSWFVLIFEITSPEPSALGM